MHDSKYYKEVREKREILRQQYGGMMTITDLMKEFGYKTPKPARERVKALGIAPTRIDKLTRYDTDLIAKALVDGRGMASGGY